MPIPPTTTAITMKKYYSTRTLNGFTHFCITIFQYNGTASYVDFALNSRCFFSWFALFKSICFECYCYTHTHAGTQNWYFRAITYNALAGYYHYYLHTNLCKLCAYYTQMFFLSIILCFFFVCLSNSCSPNARNDFSLFHISLNAMGFCCDICCDAKW